MCKTYEAIYELLKHVKSNILICTTSQLKIEGELHRCTKEFSHDECYKGIITLKNATVKAFEYEKHYEWLNIPSKHIQTFAFKCCEKEV